MEFETSIFWFMVSQYLTVPSVSQEMLRTQKKKGNNQGLEAKIREDQYTSIYIHTVFSRNGLAAVERCFIIEVSYWHCTKAGHIRELLKSVRSNSINKMIV
jgi:hypothetical protein